MITLQGFDQMQASGATTRPPMDVTKAFETDEGYSAPSVFGEVSENHVFAYAVKGARWAQKYVEVDGELLRRGGRLVVREFDDELKGLTALCVRPVANMSFQEIYRATRFIKSVQGITGDQVERIAEILEIDPGYDTGFIFGGPAAKYRAKLNRIWLDEVLEYGDGGAEKMKWREARLMKKVIPPEVLAGNERAVLENSYMHGRELYTEEPTEFLRRKVRSYQAFMDSWKVKLQDRVASILAERGRLG